MRASEDWIQKYEYNEWDAVDEQVPFRVKTDESDEVARLLLLDDWYEKLATLYHYFRTAGDVITIQKPTGEVLEQVYQAFQELTLTGEIAGVRFGISLLRLIAHVAKKGISLGKFTYKKRGFGEGPFGEGAFGSSTIAREVSSSG